MNIHSLLESMVKVGIFPIPMPDINKYAQIQRFHIKGDAPSSKNGWLISFNNGFPIVIFGSWKTGITSTWIDSNTNKNASLNINRIMSNARKDAERKLIEHQYRAAEQCHELWHKAKVVSTHPYAQKKQINLYGCKRLGHILIVPIYDINNHLISLQFIQPNGNKYFKAGGRTTGGMHWIGDKTNIKKILICEGYATAATLHQATDLPVVCAFNASNLAPVSVNIRSQYPSATIVICSDNDQLTPGNPGVTKAKYAAQLAQCCVVIPKFDRKNEGTDFNDIHVNCGLCRVKNLIIPLIEGETV